MTTTVLRSDVGGPREATRTRAQPSRVDPVRALGWGILTIYLAGAWGAVGYLIWVLIS